MRIFLADDEKHALKYLFDCLTELRPEAELVSFDRSDEALEYIRKDAAFDVAFLDISMPVINGVELAKELKKINPTVNIVFCTAHEQYAMDAIKLHVSGYVCKPYVKENIETELANLLHPIESASQEYDDKLVVRCFGMFDVNFRGEPLAFKRKKTKELFAYLIDKRGAVCSPREICADILEANGPDYLRKLTHELSEVLAAIGAENVFFKKYKEYYIVPKLIKCDYYDYLDGDPKAVQAFRGEYMSQYSWAESTLATLYYNKE